MRTRLEEGWEEMRIRNYSKSIILLVQYCRYLIVFFIFLFDASLVSADGISFGVRAPTKPFMWTAGKSIDEAELNDEQRARWLLLSTNIEQMSSFGAEWNVVYVRQWMESEDEAKRLKRVVEEHEKRGIKVVFRVFENPSIYHGLEGAALGEFGYSQKYYHWIQKLAIEFKGRVHCYLIGNETEVDLSKSYSSAPDMHEDYVIDYNQYSKVLATATKAIRSVDSQTRIANGGFTDKSLAFAVAKDIFEKKGIAEAHTFYRSWKDRGGIKVEGQISLLRQLSSDRVVERVNFVKKAIRDPAGGDTFQLHYYGNWRALQNILDWINEEMVAVNSTRPIIATEVGYGMSSKKGQSHKSKRARTLDYTYYSQLDHAANTVKVFVTLAGNGIYESLYWNIRDIDDSGTVARLFRSTNDPGEFISAPVNRAFSYMSEALAGAVSVPGKLSKHKGVWEYRFHGDSDVSVVWSEEVDLRLVIPEPAQIFDMEGNAQSSSTITGPVNGPIYVRW
ncbi:hypothetical protein EYC98_08940 [Halieaceae bacterium IMCC14734]|uniref:Glycoside hydrolase family 5 domain-containing protein n=1 Tax=Candidatus Litorirhabdus singularis TaxID=2518993 RepID=A0ABT3TFB8_9GAMM|nr:hypothetical protein [Candidatus Litorirhabdus singularis]MCX2980988.1 hypothetical protein [Candidatus Litorirhabdus singularis]